MADAERATGERSDAGPGGEPGGRRTVLVVDDEAALLHFVAAALRADGYEVLTAAGGREAMRTVFSSYPTPNLLVTDIAMPGMSGVELAARLTAERPSMRVLIMTGRPDSVGPALDRTMVAGVLLKPFSVDELVRAVAQALLAPTGG